MDEIIIKGAKENNLKNINLTIPRNKFVVFTGVSGSGKSTLAFDTIFAEGQRRYVESLSSYARMFLGQTQKPDVESIDGLSPSICIDQKTTNHNPRSTVGTVTEIYDYLRLLFARIGTPYCPNCHKPIEKQPLDQIVEKILSYEEGSKVQILAPVVRGEKGAFAKLFESLKKDGYSRVIVDGENFTLDDKIVLNKNKKHFISVIIDRLVINAEILARLTESVEVAIKLSNGLVVALCDGKEELFSTLYSCPECGYVLEEITPRLFSFNAPFGACEKCSGIGYTEEVDVDLVLANKKLSVREGGLAVNGWRGEEHTFARQIFEAVGKSHNIDLDCPLEKLPKEDLQTLLYGTGDEKYTIYASNGRGFTTTFEGIVNNLNRRYHETNSEFIKQDIARLIRQTECSHCHGKRLNEKALSVKIDGKTIIDLTNYPVDKLYDYLCELKLSKAKTEIAESILKEIKARLRFMIDVGLNYLTLSRSAETLSGGEAQRIRLATQIGSGLVGVLYILDEPSIGLHQRDNDRLLKTLTNLRDLGNSVIVVEHDEDTIRTADFIVDVGPYAGVHGGEIVATGSVQDIENCERSITGKFLSGEEKISLPKYRRIPNDFIEIIGAKENNLQNIDVKIPTGVFTAVTGVSGSGKSSLINRILYPYASNEISKTKLQVGKVKKIKNLKEFDKVINIEQSPIGRTPRSNPATYTGVFTLIRELFATTIEAKERGYTASRFSFNVKGGRCDSCEGAGVKEIEMYFLPDITDRCDVCKGKRYNHQTLEVKYKGKSIADVLDMTVEDACKFFENIPNIKNKLKSIMDVGLGYIKLGQSATELSGGEAQRVKLATELSKKTTGKTLYILDEPTTGLSMYDVKNLMKVLHKLVDAGNTVVVIEHNLDVIKCADYIIDLGPEGGSGGGTVVATGTPEEIARVPESFTGKYLQIALMRA